MEESNENNEQSKNSEESIVKVDGLYREWFLDYASYVILERAVPSIFDGLKPVQRRIFHSMKELDDGRYSKVANLVGNTMKYHPHGDASITDAMVQIGQKDLFIDTQGNWGNTLTGDGAAAARYIEARLSPLAVDVIFSPKVTDWVSSYDGRNKEPVNLPVKFPLLLAQGVEGIAVGLSTRILPHNFNELIDASIKILKGNNFEIYPDFLNGGYVDVSNYNEGLRGGKVKVRAKIEKNEKGDLVIKEIPFGTTTSSLIENILKANEKGKIKIKKIEDNTAAVAEINIFLPSGVSPDKTIDALYAFTDCEISISPMACVIENNRPLFISVKEILKKNTEHTRELLGKELEIQLKELEEKWHFASLERIFIENRIYRLIEEEESWEGVISAIDKGLQPHIGHLKRAITEDDIVRLTEIRIKRISKFDIDKAKQLIESLETNIEEVKFHLANLTDFAINYFKNLKKKYGKGRERKTEIRQFDEIKATRVALKNTKFYINREEGFIGTSLKKDEYLFDCSDIDNIIVFLESGKMLITKVESKTFVGKNILHAAVWRKNDKRTIYNCIYADGDTGISFMKRFAVTSIIRDKEYDITQGKKDSKVLYFSANPNGEAELVQILLRPRQKLKKLRFDINFMDLAIKGRGVKGNRVAKTPIRKVELKEEGVSTLSARKIWFDTSVRRLNVEERGDFIGAFSGEEKILTYNDLGFAQLKSFELTNHFEDNMVHIEKWVPQKPLTCVYFDAERGRYYVKRFLLDNQIGVQQYVDVSAPKSKVVLISADNKPRLEVQFKKDKEPEVFLLDEFIEVKGIKAKGNQLVYEDVKKIKILPSEKVEVKQDITSNSDEGNPSAPTLFDK